MVFSNYRADKIALSTRGPRAAFKRLRTLMHACEPGWLSHHARVRKNIFCRARTTLLFGILHELFMETVLASSTLPDMGLLRPRALAGCSVLRLRNCLCLVA